MVSGGSGGSVGEGIGGSNPPPPPVVTDNVTISPNDAKVVTFIVDRFYTYDYVNTSREKKGSVLFCSKDQYNWANLIYADKDVTIKGTYTVTGWSWSSILMDYELNPYPSSIDKYNISLKAGWNYLYQTDDGTYTSSVSTSIPEYYKWRVLTY
jgi:hypothetical protein